MLDQTQFEREVRFALVVYGGVSLAVYINGVTQEMLHLVHSTHDELDQLSPVEQVYRRLACFVGEPARKSKPDALVQSQLANDRKNEGVDAAERPSRVDHSPKANISARNRAAAAYVQYAILYALEIFLLRAEAYSFSKNERLSYPMLRSLQQF